ncbi:MAG: phenylalanine--tRNA ligase subunit beta [candidate division Zixibacteria bacterium HGW-Zixibacteria-1]|nr:MAG: phenylalanine--tRNA ligase subunit beta [candidate division Zixibacteria bacterium HGW-Zixibacteria-1]
MQVPYSWIKELADIPWSAEELANRLTLSGAEAEVERLFGSEFDNICIGKIVELEPIEGTDHLKKAIVDSGDEKLQVVCGAPNAASGQKVVLAKIGAVLKEGFKIKKAKLRGVESNGMICSERELGISDDHNGIIVLDDDAPIGAPALDYLNLQDPVIELDLTPNRPDMLSAIGVARDCACLAGTKLKRPEYTLEEAAEKTADFIKVSIDDPDACPRYAARVIRNVKIGPSPWWIKRKLILCGIRPISNVVDITNLVMMEYGHPLHAFDYNLFDRKEILVRRAQEAEEFTTLDGKPHVLDPYILLITDGEKGVAAAGVMGGLETEVSEKTTDILLEAAYFNPITIRKSRIKLGLISESSTRFEKGADPNVVPAAINRAAYLMNKYAGGEVLAGIVDCYAKKINPVEIELRPERVNAFLGTMIPVERMVKILRDLEYTVSGEETLKVLAPTHATDVTREVDLIEEIIRIEGYESIPFIDRNSGPLVAATRIDDLFRAGVRHVMTGQGFDETYSSGLADARLLAQITGDQPQLQILNPIAEDLSVLQNSVIYSLLKSISHNLSRRNIDLRLFELGKGFLPGEPHQEMEQLGMAISGSTSADWYAKPRQYEFYDLKGAVDALILGCRLPQFEFVANDSGLYVEGLSFVLRHNEIILGHAGMIRPDIAKAFDIKQNVYTALFEFDKIMNLRGDISSFKPLPRYPASPKDMAMVVDDEIRMGDIMAEIRRAGGPLLEDVRLFDLYRGKQVPEGKKSLAFAMVYRSDKGNLENKEVIDLHNKIADHLKKCFNVEIREG